MTTDQRIENRPQFERYIRFLESIGALEGYVEIRIDKLIDGVGHYERGVKLCTKRAQELGIVTVKVEAAWGEGRRPNAYKLSMPWSTVVEKLPQWAAARQQVKVKAAEKRAADRKAKGLRPHGTRIKRDPVTVEPDVPPAPLPPPPPTLVDDDAMVGALASRFLADDDNLAGW